VEQKTQQDRRRKQHVAVEKQQVIRLAAPGDFNAVVARLRDDRRFHRDQVQRQLGRRDAEVGICPGEIGMHHIA
jgi:hypothetical protein